MTGVPWVPGLVRACHPGPTVAVTTLTALLAVAAQAPVGTGALVTGAVFTGQLTIGWSNDLLDAERDRAAGRRDKPVADGAVPVRVVRRAAVVALVLTLVLSLLCGWAAAVAHLVLVVMSGWAYNLGLKGTAWSWLPYAVAFGALPSVVWLTVDAALPPGWMMLVGALLGVGAHLLNVLPDLADDERTGVRGLPHRLGERRTRLVAPLLLLTGSVVVVLAPAGSPSAWGWAALAVSGALAVLAWRARGATPFVAATALAVVNVGGLVLAG